MKGTQKLSNYAYDIKKRISTIFDEEALNNLARKTKFVRRSTSKLQGAEFVELLTTEMLEEPNISYEALCEILAKLNSEADITPQALEQRVNSDGAVNYLKAILQETLCSNMKSKIDSIDSKLLEPFKNVYLEDSTQSSLYEKLADEFKGSGGNASKAAIKIDLVYEVKRNTIHQLLVSKGATSDQSRAWTFVNELKPSDLFIRDLGYSCLPAFAAIDDKGAFYLSRLNKLADVYLNKDDEKPIVLAKYIKKKFHHLNVIELTVYVGKKERLPCRLIAYRLPQNVVNEKKQKAKKSATKKGRTLKKEDLCWLEFNYYITNVPQEIWSADVIGTVYRLRWQIELIFKNWKSLLQIHVLKGTRPERIRCLVFGRLISIIIVTMLGHYGCCYARRCYQREISFYKVVKWLKHKGRLGKAIQENMLNNLFTQSKDHRQRRWLDFVSPERCSVFILGYLNRFNCCFSISFSFRSCQRTYWRI